MHSDLLHIKAEQHYIRISSERKNIIVRHRFASAIDGLPISLGVQVHRSFWIALRAIKDVSFSSDGRGEIVSSNGELIPVSRSFRKQLIEALRYKRLESGD